MTPKQKRKHIAIVEQASIRLLDGSSEKMGKSARAAARKHERLTSTGIVCHKLEITYRPQLMLGIPSAHMQFYEREIDGKRNSID
tara:strand:- start:702 stop:956 length:255 start_codon:yes stop_codon:yes gene_type:complete